jgi:hypothetical protein
MSNNKFIMPDWQITQFLYETNFTLLWRFWTSSQVVRDILESAKQHAIPWRRFVHSSNVVS